MKTGVAWLAVFLSLISIDRVGAQQCDDFDSCTMNDMCAAGECTGTPSSGGSCDDNNACTINDTCVAGTCTGTQAPAGTACGGGCGMCQVGFCIPDITQNGQPCNDGFGCTTNDVCQFGFCFGTLRQCPDSDGNPCTADFCNPENGQCQATTFPPCLPCQTCRVTGGSAFVCDTAPDGTACDDFEACTNSSSCSDGECIESTGGPTPTVPPTPTGVVPPTATPPTPSASTPTVTPTGGVVCVGDCNLDGMVTVDEIIIAVNIALGSRPVTDCLPADSNLDGQVTVDEIVTAVNRALNGC